MQEFGTFIATFCYETRLCSTSLWLGPRDLVARSRLGFRTSYLAYFIDHVVLLLLIMLPLTRARTKQSVAQSTQLFLRYYHRLAAYYMSFGYLWGCLWYSSSSLILRRSCLSNGRLSTYACDRCSSSLTPLACRGLNVLTENGSFEMDQRHLDTWIHRHVIIIIIIRFTGFWRIITGSHHYWPLGSCRISPDLFGLFLSRIIASDRAHLGPIHHIFG